jgi:hypothetical protein
MQTIVFLTLFLGLVEGRQVVEMAAAEEVARVEVLIDGELGAVITGGPPWRAPVDLGDELAPRRLEAVARDAAGEEVGRAEQWLNLPRARAEVTLLVDPSGPQPLVRVGWRAVEHAHAESVAVSFDGGPVPVTAPADGRWVPPLEVPLPQAARDQLHLVSAEVAFPDGSRSRADVAFGGPFGEAVASELTGVAVEVDRPQRLLAVEDAGAWLRAGGDLHRPVALDHGAVSLYTVVARTARAELDLAGVHMARTQNSGGVRVPTGPRTSRQGLRESPLRQVGLRPGDRLYLVRPQVEASAAGILLFGVSEPLDDRRGGSAWQLSYVRLADDPEAPQRLADATATAGREATGSSRPRGVLLLLGPGSVDDSVLDPGQVRRYFARLRVPLEVWYVDLGAADRRRDDHRAGESRKQRRARRLAEARQRWGEVLDVASSRDWVEAHRRLRDDLERQRILWIEGGHPPQAVTLQGAPEWLRLVGGGAVD